MVKGKKRVITTGTQGDVLTNASIVYGKEMNKMKDGAICKYLIEKSFIKEEHPDSFNDQCGFAPTNENEINGIVYQELKNETVATSFHHSTNNLIDRFTKDDTVDVFKDHLVPPSAISKLAISSKKSDNAHQPKKCLVKNTTRKKIETSQSQLTDFYKIRRSSRKTRTAVLKEKRLLVEEKIVSGIEEGLEVLTIVGKGRGVVTTKEFKRGEFVVEYSGELIDNEVAKKREAKYAQDKNTGCYMYYFLHNCRKYCVDATEETGKLGRLINHSKTGNLSTKSFVIDGVPHLIFVANRDIMPSEELLYDYGDRTKESLEAHPWLAT